MILDRARAAAARARADGSLQPLRWEPHEVLADGVPFVVRRITAFGAKPRGSREVDPFLPPYTDALFVQDWPPAHALLLNKFPVLDDHLLLVTRAWADQEDPADPADWDALELALAQVDGLGFYNGGRAAGASQPHRHLQLVSREALGALPLEPAIRDAVARGRQRVEAWPFPHLVSPDVSFRAYERALAQLGGGPHSALRTREWLLVVPRSTPEVGGMPVNSLGYVGLLVVKDEHQLERLRRDGPFGVLAAAAPRL